MEEATMTKGTKFVKTSNFHTLYGPVSCSKKGGGRLISFPRKSKQHESGRCFHPSQNIKFTRPAAFKVRSRLLDPL